MSESKKIQVISRAVKVLQTIGKQPGGMSLGEIAKEVNLPRSTIQRIVAALEIEGFTRSEGAGRILLGSAVFRLASTSYADILSLTQNLLRKLSDKTHETIVLTQSNDAELLIVHRFLANRQLQVIPRIGMMDKPIYFTASGRALLSLYDDEEVADILGDKITKPQEFYKNLAVIRANGFEYDHGKTIEGITSIAIAMNTFLGSFGISMLVPENRYKKNKDFYLNELLKVKDKILIDIGVKPSK